MNHPNATITIVLETHNLHAGERDARAKVLTELSTHLRPQLDACAGLTEVLVTHTGTAPCDAEVLSRASGRAVRFVELEPTSSYYEAKNRGFAASTGDIVVFADSDCRPEADWLARLLRPIRSGLAQVSAGRTRYRDDVLGRAVSLLDFLYVTRKEVDGRVFTRNFYANNVAFVRAVFEAHPYREGPFFRGQCQVLGVELAEAKIPIAFVGDAVTVHRFPDHLSELLELRLRRGGDLAHLAPRLTAHAGLELGDRNATAITWLARQAIAHRDLATHGDRPLRRACIEGVALGIAVLDGLGTVLRATPRDYEALSYLTDRDALSAR